MRDGSPRFPRSRKSTGLKLSEFRPTSIRRALEALDHDVGGDRWPEDEQGRPNREGRISKRRLSDRLRQQGVNRMLAGALLRDLVARRVIRLGKAFKHMTIFVSFAGEHQDRAVADRYLHLNRRRWHKYFAAQMRNLERRCALFNGAERRSSESLSSGGADHRNGQEAESQVARQLDKLKALERRIIQVLYRKGKTEAAARSLPSQEVIGTWIDANWDGTLKHTLSTLVKAEFLDNAKHLGRRGGYFLTPRGVVAGRLLNGARLVLTRQD